MQEALSVPTVPNENLESLALAREAMFTFLNSKNADRVRHSGKTLRAHLEGVEGILREWRLPEATIRAGLFHSVYGTEFFQRAILQPDDRDQVRELIGEEAERLAYLYCGMRTDSFRANARKGEAPYALLTRWQDEAFTLNDAEMKALGAIFAANWLEQLPRMRAKSLAARMEEFRYLATWLGGLAEGAIGDVYGFGQMPLEITRATPPVAARDSEKIEMWDDAVPTELMVQLAGLVDLNIWRYGWKASHEQTAYGFWHSHFGGDDDDKSEQSCEHDLLGRRMVKPVLDLWRRLEAGPLKDHILVRVYANGHTFGGDGHLHRDHSDPGHYTTIYYAHPVWEPNWAGETVFFNRAQDDIIRAIYPKPGRMVHFPGYIMHAARSPSRECATLRAVIVLKTRLKRDDELHMEAV